MLHFRGIGELSVYNIIIISGELGSCCLLHSSDGIAVQVRVGLTDLREFSDRVLKAEITKKFEVDELEQTDVKFSEGTHYLVIYIERQSLVELIRGYPSDWDSHDLYSVVDALDGEEGLGKVLSDCAVKHEISVQSLALLNILLVDFQSLMLGKLGE